MQGAVGTPGHPPNNAESPARQTVAILSLAWKQKLYSASISLSLGLSVAAPRRGSGRKKKPSRSSSDGGDDGGGGRRSSAWYGNVDIILERFSRISQPRAPRTRRVVYPTVYPC